MLLAVQGRYVRMIPFSYGWLALLPFHRRLEQKHPLGNILANASLDFSLVFFGNEALGFPKATPLP